MSNCASSDYWCNTICEDGWFCSTKAVIVAHLPAISTSGPIQLAVTAGYQLHLQEVPGRSGVGVWLTRALAPFILSSSQVS